MTLDNHRYDKQENESIDWAEIQHAGAENILRQAVEIAMDAGTLTAAEVRAITEDEINRWWNEPVGPTSSRCPS